mgnify:CR=1 FL=1
MKQTTRSLLIMTVVTTLFLAGCADPSDKTPDAVVNDVPATEAPAVEAPKAEMAPAETPAPEVAPVEEAPAMEANTYTIAPASTVGFIGSKISGSHEGGFKTFAGTVSLPGEDVTEAVIDVTIEVASAFTDNEKLTAHLLSADFFDAEQFPQSTFVSTAIAKEGDAYSVTGNFTLHGVTKSITFPATLSLDGDTFTASAEFDINRMDFGVKYAGKTDDLIRENVVIQLNIEASA